MRKNSNIILPRNKYEAYRKYIASLRLLGHGGIADDAIKVYSDKIVLNLEYFVILLNYPDVVRIPDFVDEVV